MAEFTPEQLRNLITQLREALEGILGVQTQTTENLTALNIQREREAATMQASIEQAKRKIKHAATALDQQQAQIALNNTLIELNDTQLDQLKQEYEQGQLTTAMYRKQAGELLRLNKELRDSSTAIEDAAAKSKQLDDVLGQLPFGSFITKVTKMRQTFLKLNKVVPGTLPLVFGAAMIGRMVQFALALHQTEAAFMKATGAIRDYARVATDAYLATRLYGVTAAAASESAQALYGTFTDFTFASTAQQQSLTQTGALLNRLGVSYSDYAKNIQMSTKALGMSTEEAEANQADLALMARNMGVPVAQLSSQYASMAPKLAKLGSAGNKAFKDLARVQKITGLEMEKVLAITDKFDTFEGAADQAGKLNAALGGNFVNAMDLMMETDPAKRFEMIRDSITQTGLSFNDMSYYQRKFFVDSIDGLNDVGDLAMMMSGNMDLLAGSTEKTQDEMIKLKEAAAATQTLSESWQSLVASLTPALTPLIDGLAKFFGYIQDPKNEEFLSYLRIGLGAIAVALGLVALGTMAALAPLIIMGAKIAIVVGIVAALVAGLGKLLSPFKSLGNLLFKKKQSPYTFTEGIENLAGTDGKSGFGGMARMQRAVLDNNIGAAATGGSAPVAAGGGGKTVIEIPVVLNGAEIARVIAPDVEKHTNRQRAVTANNRY